jgi:hypothetical protein
VTKNRDLTEEELAELVKNIRSECPYTPKEAGKILNYHPKTVRRKFKGQAGVVETGSEETLHKRGRTSMRIYGVAIIRVLRGGQL